MPWKDKAIAKQKKHESYLRHREETIAAAKQYYEDHKAEISKNRKDRDYKAIYNQRRPAFLRDHIKYTHSEKGKNTRRKRQRIQLKTDNDFRAKKDARDTARHLIPLKEACELCGSKEKLERHHPDYSKPREIQTLCYICHGKVHGIRREQNAI